MIIDDLAAHKMVGVQETFKLVGARLEYLPPNSPDLNPIELAFAKLKAMLRSAAFGTSPSFFVVS